MIPVKDKLEVIAPVRIVKTFGKVENADNLLKTVPVLSAQFTLPNITKLTKNGEENPYILLDFGKELHGGIRLSSLGNSKRPIKLRFVFGESVSEALSYIGYKGATNDHSPRDFETLISALTSVEIGSTGFRFLKVELVEEGFIEIKNISAILRVADIEKLGFINTSDSVLNKVLDTAIYTNYLNLQNGVIWDGIKRDRLIWCGDLNSELLTTAYIYGMVPHIKNCLEIINKDTPRDAWVNTIATYSMWWIVNLIDYYTFSGDLDFVNENMEFLNHILGQYNECITDNGLDFALTCNHKCWYFLDWPTADTPEAFTGSMLLTLYTMQKLKKANLQGVNYELVEKIYKAVEKFPEVPAYKKQITAFQVLCGTSKNVKECLEEGGANGFSTFMMYYILKGLAGAGSEKCLELATTYYNAMLERGATTFWEDFDIEWLEGSGRIDEETPEGLKDLHADYGKFCYIGLRHSFCHGWSSGIVGFVVEDVLGLKVVEAGYKKVQIKPNLYNLDFIEGSVPTPYGDIYIKKEKGKEVEIVLPKGVELVK